MAKSVKLLLTESVENLGIVGDVVSVRTGYARNFLLPRNLATQPSEERVRELAAKRADAERQLALLRKQREDLCARLQGVEVTLQRSCNDQGILYGAITQQDVSTALGTMGYGVKARDVRISQAIKRIDAYDVHIKLDSDLDAQIKLWVVADRELDLHKDEPSAGPAAESAEGEKHEGKKGKKADRVEKAEPAAEPKAEKSKAEKPKADKKSDGEGKKSKKKDA
jgi:large subunit ribosomal protein L9